MAKREEYERKTEQLLEPILKENNFELYDVEFVKEAGTFYLRAYIDKEGGININDCELVSRRLSDLLDEKDFIPDAYILEVSSPGIDRPLTKPEHFSRFAGYEAKIETNEAIDGRKRFKGKIIALDKNNAISFAMDDKEYTIPFDVVAKAKLVLTDELLNEFMEAQNNEEFN